MPPVKSKSPKQAQVAEGAAVRLLHGPEGVGKSTLASHFPACEFVHDPQERGIVRLVRKNLCPTPFAIHEISDWRDLLITLDNCRGTDSQTVVVESITGLETLCFKYHCDTHYNGDFSKKGFFSYQEGPIAAAQDTWPKFMDVCDRLTEAGKNVIITAHSEVREYENPQGPNYDRFMVSMNSRLYRKTKRWVSDIWFLNWEVDMEKGTNPFKPQKGKVTEKSHGVEIKRNLYTTYQPSFDAKSQGMPGVFSADDSASLIELLTPYL